MADAPHEPEASLARTAGRWALAAVLAIAGVGHFPSTAAFTAQVPTWLPQPEAVVATFFVLVFPGNVAQLLTQTDAFGLDTDLARAIRLLFQPVLVVWALWSTGAWRAWRGRLAA
jgi:uncharacterized membrane protein